MKKNVFVCYESTTGQSYSEHLKKALEKSINIKYEVFLADITLRGGDDWEKKINIALENCHYFIVIITALTMDSLEVKKEYDKATLLNKIIIPFRFSGIDIEETYEISKLQQISFVDKYDLANKTIIEFKKIEKQKSISINKESNEFFRRGNLLYSLKMYDESLVLYKKVIEINKKIPEAWANMSKIYSNFNKDAEALYSIEKALEIEPKFSDAWLDKGLILYDLSKYDDALLAFETAVEINPKFADAWGALGALLGETDHHSEAIKAFNNKLLYNPNDYHIWSLKGYSFFKLKQFDEAENAFNNAISLKPDYAEAWYYKACLNSQKNDKVKTKNCLVKAIKQDIEFKNTFLEDKDFNNIVSIEDIKKYL